MIEGAEGTTIEQCEFVRLGGNAVALSGHAWHTTIASSEFFKIGDSAIVTVGDFKQNDGVVSRPQQLPSLPLLVHDPWQRLLNACVAIHSVVGQVPYGDQHHRQPFP